MKLEEGMYVRTKTGLIAKYIGYEKDDELENSRYKFDGKIYWYYEYYNDYVYAEDFKECFEEKVVKTSHNIIDLIEEGDYVNGLKITLINEPSMANCYKRIVYAEDDEGYLIKSFNKNEIKSIVTKEQFESMSYKVGE